MIILESIIYYSNKWSQQINEALNEWEWDSIVISVNDVKIEAIVSKNEANDWIL